jgi:hypothetical protein
LLHWVEKQTCLVLGLTLMATAEQQISETRFDGFTFRTFNTNPA